MQSIIERMGQGWKLARNVSLRKDPKEDVREKSVEKSTDSLQHGSPLYRKQKTKMIKQRPINTVMKITNNPAARDRPQTMDEERQGHTAYNYLCHLESTRRWMEACLQEELPETIDMERALSNGVYLARLAKIFDRDPVTQRAKIYDDSLEIFETKGLTFRHTDNINHWLTAMKNVNVPNLYMPETSDVYNQRNMPKVISCIFALSHILYQNGMAPKIQNLVGKVEFSDDDISAIQTALVRYGVKLPQFSTVGGQLAKELSSDLAGMHAAILAINQTVDKQVTADTLDALKITKAHIDHVQECYRQAYQEMLWRARTAKRHKSSEAMSDSQDVDVYLTNLTQCEIQHVIDDVNHDKALGEINAAIIISDALTLQTALENHHAMVRGTRPHMVNLYLSKLQQVRSTALNLKTIQKIISQVNQNTEETQKELKRLRFLESAVAVQAAVRLQAWCRGEATRKWWKSLNDKALGEINEAIIVSDTLALQAALDNHHAMVRGTRPHLANLYLTELQQVCSTALNLKTIQKIISQVNQNIEETQKELKRLRFLESAVAVQAAVRLQAWCRGEATRRWWRYLKGNEPTLWAVKRAIEAFMLPPAKTSAQIDQEYHRFKMKVVNAHREVKDFTSSLDHEKFQIKLMTENKLRAEESTASLRRTRTRTRTRLFSRKSSRSQESVTKRYKPQSLIEEHKAKKINKEYPSLDIYSHLFYQLHNNPEYLAQLLVLERPKESDPLSDMILATHSYGQGARDNLNLNRIYKRAISVVVAKVSHPSDFLESSSGVIALMLERVRSKTVHHKRLSELLTKSTMAVSGIHKNFDLKIMTNVQEIQQENGCDEETALMCYGYSTKALQCIFQRLLTFMSKYKMWPQSLVTTLVHTRQELTEKFGEDTEMQSQILKIIGRILIHEYVSPMFKDQREMDEEYLNQSEDPLSANDRANLKLISKYLEMAAEGCGAFPDNNTTEEVLKEILWDTWVSLRDLFDEISRPRAVDERHITLDSAMMPQKLWMTPSNLCTAQELLLRHLDNMGLAENDPLKSTLTALPDINTIRCEEYRKSLWFTTIYELGLLPPNAQSTDCMTPAAQMVFSQVKAQMVTLLAHSSVDTVRDLVSMPITPQMEERFHQESLRANDPVFVFSRNSWQTLSNDSDPDSEMSSTTSGEKSKGSTRGSVGSAVEDTTIAGKTLLEIQESLRNGLTQLHSAGCFGTGEEYQMLVDELAKDILSMPLKRERIEDMQFSLREVKAKMDALRIEKRQLAVYSTNSSSEQCIVPKKKKKSLMSKSAKHPYGYIKMPASDLIDMGVITHISGLGSMPKSKRLKCKIYSDEMGVYVFKLNWLPKGFQYKKKGVEVWMEDLLRSCIDSTRMEASSGPFRYRTDLMLQFLKAEFLTHTDRESNQ